MFKQDADSLSVDASVAEEMIMFCDLCCVVWLWLAIFPLEVWLIE